MNTVKQIPIPKQHTHLPAKEEIHKETLKNRHPNCLTTETVESTALTLQGIDDIEGSDCLSLWGLSIDFLAGGRLNEPWHALCK